MLPSILTAYGFDAAGTSIKNIDTGLINQTWLIKHVDKEYILQKINRQVFKNPCSISDNIRAVDTYLQHYFPGYLFIAPILSQENKELVYDGKDYYRLFPFVKNSVTFTTLQSPELAYEAAKQFGKFTHLLSGFDASLLQETLPGFHNLTLRCGQFQESLLSGNKERIEKATNSIQQIKKYNYIAEEFEKIKTNPNFKKRVTHHDTKISNVLFDNKNKGLCIIDLDTIMPGYFISDVGDMIRTYLSPASEEEKEFTKIEVRENFFYAIAAGYLSEMKADLTEEEKNSFVYAGKFMIYMQAVRFLTDYLNDDVYYGSKYEGHNLMRANNQLYLLELLCQREDKVMSRIKDLFSR